MRVGVITNRNLCSPWASTHFYMYRALRRLGIDAVHIAGKEIADYHAQNNRKKGRQSTGLQPAPFTDEMMKGIKHDLERNPYSIVFAMHASTALSI